MVECSPYRGSAVNRIHFTLAQLRGEFGKPLSGSHLDTDLDSQPVASIGALAVSISDPNIIYVGTGEADMRSDISFGAGMYKSTNDGGNWTYVGLAIAAR